MATRPTDRLRGALGRWGRPISNRWLAETRRAMRRPAQYSDGFRRLRAGGDSLPPPLEQRMEPPSAMSSIVLLIERSCLQD